MRENKPAGHVHDDHECDEHEHHGEEAGHVHRTHECDGHEHHGDDREKELAGVS